MMTLSPDGKTALLHYSDVVVLWDLEKKQLLNVWTDFLKQFADVALSPDGKTVVSVSSGFPSSFIKTWDVASQQMRHLISAEKEHFHGFAISPNSRKLAIVRDPWVEIRNLQTGRVETQFPYRVGYSREITFSPSGRLIAAEQDWGDLFVYDLKKPKKFQRIKQEHFRIYYQLAFSENDKYLAAAGRAKNNLYWILLWKRKRDTLVFQYAWRVPELDNRSKLAFVSRADGSFVLGVPNREEVQIWKILSNRPRLLTALDVEPPVHFSSDGRYLFANQDGKLQIWDWRKKTPIDYPSISGYFDVSRDEAILLSYAETGQIQI